ncbi:MAG: transcription termination/antitermination protein NusA [Deltaproteobacteria bacterium]|nr:transcription termination/antitermination protein NusA [Deltaproteobacteria bacterium]
MFIADIKRVVEQVSRDKGIDREVLIKALEEALRSAARKKYGNKLDIEIQYNEESGEIEIFQFKDVTDNITDPAFQISLEEGRKLDPECEIGDSLGTKMDTSTFGRIAAQSAKQVIIQKMKDAEKDAVYANFIDRKGELINGIVQRVDRGDIIVNLGQTDGAVPVREQVPRESYRRGDRIRAYILDVLQESRGPQIVLSRTHPNFIVDLFRTEVPEISEGIVNIMGASREPGVRAKIAVASNNYDIDPVGACVGMKGSRVQNVVQELRGEKIDIIPWHVDPAKFVCNALAPAEISRVIIDEDDNAMEVIVPDEFLSIAIGKKGQNVRLASKLTGWHLDVKSETRYSEAMQTGYDSLVALPGVGVSLADALYESGFYSAEEISNATIDDLVQIRGIGDEKASKLIEAAGQAAAQALAEEETNEANDDEPIADSDNLDENDTPPAEGVSEDDEPDEK